VEETIVVTVLMATPATTVKSHPVQMILVLMTVFVQSMVRHMFVPVPTVLVVTTVRSHHAQSSPVKMKESVILTARLIFAAAQKDMMAITVKSLLAAVITA
jgi:hypothetical protein